MLLEAQEISCSSNECVHVVKHQRNSGVNKRLIGSTKLAPTCDYTLAIILQWARDEETIGTVHICPASTTVTLNKNWKWAGEPQDKLLKDNHSSVQQRNKCY